MRRFAVILIAIILFSPGVYARDMCNLDAKSAASSTDNAVARFDGTGGDVQDSGVTIDDSNNVVIQGGLTVGTSTGVTHMCGRDSTNAVNFDCTFVGTTTFVLTCAADTNGVCGDGT